MMNKRIIKVASRSDRRDFHRVPHLIYKDDPNWVCPLESDIETIFNPKLNIFHSHGEIERWILKDEKGSLIGRVAAFINHKKAFTYKQPTGGMGFFECINDKAAASLLFDTCKSWLKERGMEAMDGPINFGENDSWWGLLVEGFTAPGYGMHFHKPYYKELFEEYGFSPFYEQITKLYDFNYGLPERFRKIAEWTIHRPGRSFRHFDYKNAEKFLHDFKLVYDEAWQFHSGFSPLNIDNLRNLLQKSKPLVVEDFIWFAYQEEEPIGMIIIMPDLNQVIKKLKGKLHLFNKIRLLVDLRTHKIKRARVIILGVVPKYQQQGIESALLWNLNNAIRKRTEYKEIEISWVGDFNPKMQALLEAVETKFGNKHITYRKLFAEGAKSERMNEIPVDTRRRVE